MKIKIYENQSIGTLGYDYYDMVEFSLKNKDIWPFRNTEECLNFFAEENGLKCVYFYDFVNNLFIIKLLGSITNMLRFRSSIKYSFGFKERK